MKNIKTSPVLPQGTTNEINSDINTTQLEYIPGVATTEIIRLLEDNELLDKTALYARLMVTPGSFFFIRPRRFGKTLLINALEKIANGPEYKEHFSNTQIYKHHLKDNAGNFITNKGELTNTPEKYSWPKYPVMCFCFLTHYEELMYNTLSSYLRKLLEIVEKHNLESNNITIKEAIEYINNKTYLQTETIPTNNETILNRKIEVYINFMNLIMHALVKLGNDYEPKMVVLIDEYDAIYQSGCAIDNLRAEHKRQDEGYISPFTKFINGFYQTLKNNSDLIHLQFTTGVTMLEIDDMYSPLLGANNISTDASYATLVGYTEKEIRTLFCDDLFIDFYKESLRHNYNKKDTHNNDDEKVSVKDSYTPSEMESIKDIIMGMLICQYDGYTFATTQTRIFNPISVNLSFKRGSCGDYWSQTSGNDFRWDFLRDNFDFFKKFELTGECTKVKPGVLNAIRRKCEGKDDKVITQLYQTGLLTIKRWETTQEDGVTYTLGLTNREIRGKYNWGAHNYMGFLSESKFNGQAEKCCETFRNEKWKEFCVVAYQTFGTFLYEVADNIDKYRFRKMFLIIMDGDGGLPKYSPFFKNKYEQLDDYYRKYNKNYIIEYKAGEYLLGSKTKFHGWEQTYCKYKQDIMDSNHRETVLIRISFLTKLELENIIPISSDKKDDKYLTSEARKNVNNIGQLMVVELNYDGSKKYRMEIIPNGTDEPIVTQYEISDKNWNVNVSGCDEEQQNENKAKL
eukprot:GAHX01000714.1.p1 GENE.GAHX01000714.1~~GAHX01000714.1.p1  ORF type:complete len:740 (-),score=114.50 GAHX01000714.1:51-2270(-)